MQRGHKPSDGKSLSVQRLQDEEEEVIDWVDHSNASAVEEFNAALELVFGQWGLGDLGTWRDDSSSADGEVHDDLHDIGMRSAEISLGKDKYTFTLIAETDWVGSSSQAEGLEAKLSPTEVAVLRNARDLGVLDAVVPAPQRQGQLDNQKNLLKWFGINEYVIMGHVERIANPNDVSLLLSAAGQALATCNPVLPCFVVMQAPPSSQPSHQLLQRIKTDQAPHMLCGISVSAEAASSTRFVVSIQNRQAVPKSVLNLSGLIELFRDKLGPSGAAAPPLGTEIQYHEEGQELPKNADGAEKDMLQLLQGQLLASVRLSFLNRQIHASNPALKQCIDRVLIRDANHWSEIHSIRDIAWRLHISKLLKPDAYIHDAILTKLQGGELKAPAWGPLSDPVTGVDLMVRWPAFRESSLVENDEYSGLEPESAPTWSIVVRVPTFDSSLVGSEIDPQSSMMCSLGISSCYVLQLLDAVEHGNTKSTEEDTSDYQYAESTRSAAGKANGLPTSASDRAREQKHVRQVVGEIFSLAYSEDQDEHRQALWQSSTCCWLCSSAKLSPPVVPVARRKLFKTAPLGSLLSIFVARMSEFGASLEGFQSLWASFVSEIRWRWDNLVLLPLHIQHGDSHGPTEVHPVNPNDCLLQQKLTLLNLCIAVAAHERFNHTSRATVSKEATQPKPSEDRDSAAGYVSDADGDAFFDAQSDGVENSRVSANREWVDPWTLHNALCTEDALEARTKLLASLAVSSSSSTLHEQLIREELASDMAAFKRANPNASFNDFSRWKGRSRRVGEFWRKEWEACNAASLREQLVQKGGKALFDASKEAEMLLNFLETLSPEVALSQLFAIKLESAEFILNDAVQSFQEIPEVYPELRRQAAELCKDLERIGYGSGMDSTMQNQEAELFRLRRKSAVESIERLEYTLSVTASLLHKFPPGLAARFLDRVDASSPLQLTLDNSMFEDRKHVQDLLFDPRRQDMLWPEPDYKEYLFRAFGSRPSFEQPRTPSVQQHSCRRGANRMYVGIGPTITVATALTETSFP